MESFQVLGSQLFLLCSPVDLEGYEIRCEFFTITSQISIDKLTSELRGKKTPLCCCFVILKIMFCVLIYLGLYPSAMLHMVLQSK